jgi:hypothetical protein
MKQGRLFSSGCFCQGGCFECRCAPARCSLAPGSLPRSHHAQDVSTESYNDFFKQTFSEFLDPLAHVHFNVEGTIEFAAILYIPGMAPFDQQNMQQRSRSIKVCERVF